MTEKEMLLALGVTRLEDLDAPERRIAEMTNLPPETRLETILGFREGIAMVRRRNRDYGAPD